MECAVSTSAGSVGSLSSTFIGVKSSHHCRTPNPDRHSQGAKQGPIEVTCRRKGSDSCRRPVRQPDSCYRPQSQPQQEQQQQLPPRNDYARLATVGRGGSTEGPGTEWYTVQPGDSLFGIAVDRDVTVYDIRDLNGMPAGSSTVLPGQKLLVPALAPAAARASSSSSSKGGLVGRVAPLVQEAQTAWKSSFSSVRNAWSQATHTKYKVVAGDSLSGIALAKGVPISELIHLNGLSLPLTILEGQTLLLPSSRSSSSSFLSSSSSSSTALSDTRSSSTYNASSSSSSNASSSSGDAGMCCPKPAAEGKSGSTASSAFALPSQWSSLLKAKSIQLPSPNGLADVFKSKKSVTSASSSAEAAAVDTCATVCCPKPTPARKPLVAAPSTPMLGAGIALAALLAAGASGRLQPILQRVGVSQLLHSVKTSLAEIDADAQSSPNPAASPLTTDGPPAASSSQETASAASSATRQLSTGVRRAPGTAGAGG
eukprot:jgi/Mesvir1/2087/Mv16619-RA.2